MATTTNDLIFNNGFLKGSPVQHKTTLIKDLTGVFKNEKERKEMDQERLVYEVDFYQPVEPGTSGGLFFGVTRIQPGKIGEEYFMTRGHFHAIRDRAEYYWGISGIGALILMDSNRKVRVEPMKPGTLHYIPADTAHRVANTGGSVLTFGACWPSDAGYDYEEIRQHGFAERLVDVGGNPQLKPEA